MPPLISVIIPAFNASKTISRAIKSALNQDHRDFEIIVVDDGSVDDTAQIVSEIQDSRLSYIWQNNLGPSAARNRGAAAASGECLAFLDSDDEWLPNKLRDQLAHMNRHELSISITDVEECSSTGQASYCKKPDLSGKTFNQIIQLLYKGKVTRNTPTIIVKKQLFMSVGGFDEDLKNREDHHLLCKLAANGSLGNTRKALTKRHIVATSYTQTFSSLHYYSDTLIFHKKMHNCFHFLDVDAGIRRTKWLAVKRALKAKSISTAAQIIFDRKWRNIVKS